MIRNIKDKSPEYCKQHHKEGKTDLKLRRSPAFSSLPSLCQVTLGAGTARNGTGMCNFSVSTTTRSRVWKSRAGLPGNKTHTPVGANLKFHTSAFMQSQNGSSQSDSLAKTFSEMSEGSLMPTELMALTLKIYSFSGTTPSSTRYFSSFTGRELTLIHFSVPASHISMW